MYLVTHQSTSSKSLSHLHFILLMPLFLLSGLIIFSKYLLSHGEHRKVEAICLSRPAQSLPLPIQQHLYFCPWFLLLHHIIFTAVALNSTPTVTVKIIPLCLSAHAFILSSVLALSPLNWNLLVFSLFQCHPSSYHFTMFSKTSF